MIDPIRQVTDGDSLTIKPVACPDGKNARRSPCWSPLQSGRMVRAAILAIAFCGVLTPMTRAAGPADDEDLDGRMVGYSGKKVSIEKSSATPVYLMYFVLVAIGCIPMFKNAKRE